jgi:hypothetical protein
MYRSISIILSALIMTIAFGNYPFQIAAQDSLSTCDNDLNFFLFNYYNPLEYSEIIEAASCDINYFWTLVEDLPVDYQPPDYVVQEYSSFPFATPNNFIHRTQNGACNIRPTFVNARAYYCTSPYSIVISEPAQLVNYMQWEQNHRGRLAITLVLAHEWSHHIQLSVLNNRDMPELQAECFVGSYFRFAISNPRQTLLDFSQDDWDALMQVIPISSNEAVGNIERWEDITVGEQGRALRMGYREGISRCLSVGETTDNSE